MFNVFAAVHMFPCCLHRDERALAGFFNQDTGDQWSGGVCVWGGVLTFQTSQQEVASERSCRKQPACAAQIRACIFMCASVFPPPLAVLCRGYKCVFLKAHFAAFSHYLRRPFNGLRERSS